MHRFRFLLAFSDKGVWMIIKLCHTLQVANLGGFLVTRDSLA